MDRRSLPAALALLMALGCSSPPINIGRLTPIAERRDASVRPAGFNTCQVKPGTIATQVEHPTDPNQPWVVNLKVHPDLVGGLQQYLRLADRGSWPDEDYFYSREYQDLVSKAHENLVNKATASGELGLSNPWLLAMIDELLLSYPVTPNEPSPPGGVSVEVEAGTDDGAALITFKGPLAAIPQFSNRMLQLQNLMRQGTPRSQALAQVLAEMAQAGEYREEPKGERQVTAAPPKALLSFYAKMLEMAVLPGARMEHWQ